MILEELHALESSAARDQLVAELGLVIVASAAVDLLVGILRFV